LSEHASIMPHPVYTPRLNNNDDEVRLTEVLVRVGDTVAVGQTLVQVETDKAVVAVESDRCGYILRILPEVDALVPVGSVLLWIGDTPDQIVSCEDRSMASPAGGKSGVEPTAKARSLIAQKGLNAADIPARGGRLTVEDVEAYLNSLSGKEPKPTRPTGSQPAAAGNPKSLSMEERGMLRSVLWHRDEAVSAYLEIDFDPRPWEQYAKTYAAERRMLSAPVLPLMAHQLATIARAHPRLNSTIVEGGRYVYEHVNLGFTIQAQESLYLVVVPRAEAMDAHLFIDVLNKLHRKALTHRLAPEDLSGATVAFSSMARWQVRRHTPILPPYVSLIVAHTASKDNRAVLGATYDHRVLSGGDTVGILDRLSRPPK
jgi:pyruvate/2-oxoglutarate dehydrogenase complex dihydrolipoamide acyltransferase (E2) component